MLICSVNVSASMTALSSLYCPLLYIYTVNWRSFAFPVMHTATACARVHTNISISLMDRPGDEDFQWSYVTKYFLNDPTQREKSSLLQLSHLSFLGLVLMSPRTVMSEKSMRNLLRRVAMLNGWKKQLLVNTCTTLHTSLPVEINTGGRISR